MNDLIKAGTSYAAGNAIANNIAYNLRKQREELEAMYRHITSKELLQEGVAKFILSDKRDEAYEWLNESIQTEFIGYAKQQTDTYKPLRETMDEVRQKYAPFYQKIGENMPETLASLTADSLCELLGIANEERKREEAARLIAEGKQAPINVENVEGGFAWGWMLFSLIVIILLIVGVIAVMG